MVGLREIPEGGLQRTFDLSGDFARAALADTEANADSVQVSATVTLFRTGDEILARGQLTGTVTLVCSRCVGPAPVTVAAPVEVLFLPRDSDEPDVEDVAVAHPDVVVYEDDQVDLEETLREELLLALPYAPLCSETCKGLCATCGKDLNEGKCDCPDAPDDHKFAALRDLKSEV